jgi:hypothetical protein
VKLIITSDGLIGLDFDPNCDIIWCDSVQQAAPIMHANFQHLGESAPTLEEMHHEIAIAVDACAKHHHDIAEFGIFGSFMYTTTDIDQASGF